MEATGCDRLQVNFTVSPLPNPLPNGDNEATMQSLEVTYRPIVGVGSTETRSVALNGSPAEGVLCLSGLRTRTAYRINYNVEIHFSATLPSDLSTPEELLTLSSCDQQGQCTERITSECKLHV